MPETAERLWGFTESVIRGMTRLANEHGAINLSQGFPDFDPPSSFFREPEHRYIRFHFAKKEATLHAAAQRLLKLAVAGS